MKIELLEKELIVLNYEVNQLQINAKKTTLLLDELTKKAANNANIKEAEAEISFHCKICNYKSKKEATLNKHKNTKHPDVSYKCDRCGTTFLSKDKMESHIVLNHNKDQEKLSGSLSENDVSISCVQECSLCEDKFVTKKEFKIHVANHLSEIQDIDVEHLKSGHEIFVCSICSFESNIDKDIKNHLAEHTLTPRVDSEKLAICRENKKAILKSSNWRDMYDDQGNPLFDSTDDENSSEDNENSSEDEDDE